MPLMPLKLPPGMYKNGTEYQGAARWIRGNQIRFFEKTIRPVGGWALAKAGLDGPGRGLLTWRPDDNSRAAAIGTVDKLWYYNDDQFYDITPVTLDTGNVDTVYGTGYGYGTYNVGAYGSSGAGGKTDATSWSLDTFGQYLIACSSSDGHVWIWQLNSATPAVILDAGAPVGRAVFTTGEGFIVILGAEDVLRRVAWPDQRSTSVWTADATNQAGDFDLETSGACLAGCRVRGSNLILTTVDAWTMTYVGPQVVYSFQRVGNNCGLIGANALISFLGGAGWMGYNGFYTFNGGTVAPIDGCEVSDAVFSDIDRLQMAKCHGGHNSQFGELSWWYPSVSTGGMRCVTWNYRENHWTMDGQPERTAWADRGVFEYPLATDETATTLYDQEYGSLADGVSRVGDVYVESGPVEIDTGDRVVSLLQCLPDEVTAGDWSLELAGRFTPEGGVFDRGPYTLTAKTDVRITARQVGVRLTLARDADVRIGTFRFDARTGGRR